jgi:hypothetical protein
VTLIVGFAHANVPILVGDLVVSSDEIAGHVAHLPTTGKIHGVFPPGSEYTIVSLRQKIAIVSPNCAIGFAGPMLMASHVVKELRKIGQQRPLQPDDIPAVVNEARREMKVEPVSLVGWLHLGSSVDGIQAGAKVLETERFGRVIAAGTGVDQLEDWLKPGSRGPTMENLCGDAIQDAVSRALSLIGVFLQAEVRTAETLLNYFGGGFEICWFNGSRFLKVGDITFALWEVFETGDGLHFMPGPTCVLKQDYDDDLLLIQSLRLDLSGNGPKMKHVAVHGIRPIDRLITDADKSKIRQRDWESMATMHIFAIRFENGETAVMNRLEIHSGPAAKRSLMLKSTDNGVEIGFDGGLVLSANDEIRAAAALRRAQIDATRREKS